MNSYTGLTLPRNHRRTILFVLGSRSEWGYIRPVIRRAEAEGQRCLVLATNMALLNKHGSLVTEIRDSGFHVVDELFMALEGSNHYSMTKSLGIFLTSISDTLNRIRPDWLVIAGDRGEQFMAAIAAAYTYTPVAHIQAGERSGNIDGVARHAIARLVHLHFAANVDAGERLIRSGEDSSRVHVVGAPQLDELFDPLPSRQEISERLHLDKGSPFLLVALHSVTEDFANTYSRAQTLVNAIRKLALRAVWILPNNDAGGDQVLEALEDHRSSNIKIFANLDRMDYLGLMRDCVALVGNSSSGILEAPTFGTPAINIGRRQNERIRAQNVIDTDWDVNEIVKAVTMAMSSGFRDLIADCVNPYGDGKSSPRIVQALIDQEITSEFLTKQISY